MGAAVITTMALATSKPFDENDYKSRVDVINSVDCLLEIYDQFITDLDTMQSGNGGNPEDYVANSEVLINLNSLVNFTMANLFDLALDAKQERILSLEDDSDFITLTHRLYGLDDEDENIDEMIRNNPQLGLDHYLNIKKGTEIIYYV